MIEHLLHFTLHAFLRRSWNELMHATHDPRRAQSARLLDIVSRNKETVFGREHGFADIRSVEDFRARVPVRTYEELAPYLMRTYAGEARVLTAEAPQMFCRTSGTTGAPKLIPVTPAFYEEFSKMQKMWQLKLSADHRAMLRGKILTLMSPEVEEYTECGVPCGAMSGHCFRLQYPITQMMYAAPYEVMCVRDFEAKYYLILRLALEQKVSAIAAMNPSTIMLFMRKLNVYAAKLAQDIADGAISRDIDVPPHLRRRLEDRLRPNRKRAREIEMLGRRNGTLRATDMWPELSVIVTWQGGSVGFFLQQFPEYFPGIPIRDIGLVATEGYCSIPIESGTASGLLAITGHFFEFFEVKPDGGRAETALGCEELEVGRQYYLVMTTSAGLYRYDICDIIEVTGFFNKTPLIEFRQKGGNTVSITGEKVTEVQVTEAMHAAASEFGIGVDGFVFTLVLGDPPAYRLVVETAERNHHALEELLVRFEQHLRSRNIEYAAKRDSQRLGAPILGLVETGSFEEIRKRQVRRGAPDGQYKISHVMAEANWLNGIRMLAEIVMPTAVA